MDLSEERALLLGLAVRKGYAPVFPLRGPFGDEEALISEGRREWDRAGELGFRPVFFYDPDYPEILREIPDPPAFIYVCGKLRSDLPFVAVVGARKATPYGLKIAREWSREAVRCGVGVVSGLALGVDAAAHRGALEGRGYTVAVLGCGPDRIYPYQNAGLAREILECGGALVTEFPVGAGPERWRFPRRNRIIAGLSRAVLVVEAAQRSGSLITARLAAEFGREVLAVPGSVFSPESTGTHRLIKEGAYPATSPEDLLEALGIRATPASKEPTGEEISDPLLSLIPPYPKHFDEIAAESGLAVPELAARLLELELKGLIQGLPGKYYQRT